MSLRIVGATGLFAASAGLIFATVVMAIEDESKAAPLQPGATCPAFPTTTTSPTPTTRPSNNTSTSSPSTGTTVPSGTTIPGGSTTTTECTCPD